MTLFLRLISDGLVFRLKGFGVYSQLELESCAVLRCFGRASGAIDCGLFATSEILLHHIQLLFSYGGTVLNSGVVNQVSIRVYRCD